MLEPKGRHYGVGSGPRRSVGSAEQVEVLLRVAGPATRAEVDDLEAAR
jgi:hypothetical protein